MNKAFEKALELYGLKEVPGAEHNKEILEMFAAVGHKWVDNDELAWCAAFVGYCLDFAGYAHTGRLNARSYLKIGNRTDNPRPGDLVIFWRVKEHSIYGHVAFYVNKRDGYVNVLGGNQGNKVQVSAYLESRVLEYRRISKL